MRKPSATYRVQLNPAFGFRHASALVPYLHQLGITEFYASPIFQAKPGSLSGYDVTDPSRLNPELGDDEDFRAFVEELRRHDMGLLLDIVPNHMAAVTENPWWTDVLENGASSPYANYFDIDWDPAVRLRDDKLLRPVLGGPFGSTLENGELTLVVEEGGFFVRYYERKMPLDPSTYGPLLDWPGDSSGLGLHGFQETVQIRELVNQLPPPATTDLDEIDRRYRDARTVKRRLWALYESNPEFKRLLDDRLRLFNGVRGEPRSFDALEDLLSRQPYALSYWRVAREKINYRRFFDIADLVGIRVEDPAVFEATHRLIFDLIAQGLVTGLRVDHVDGVYDPTGYLAALRSRAPDCYIVVEKILNRDEALPERWPIEGSTGYEFLNAVNAVLTEPEGLERLDAVYRRFSGIEPTLQELVYTTKQSVITQLFAGEALSLGLQLGILAEQDRHARDLSPAELRQTIVEVAACLSVYRTYVNSPEIPAADEAYVRTAIREAQRRNPSVASQAFDFLERVLLLRFPPTLPPGARGPWLRFVGRWQQFTGPAMAKGLEDTAFYVYNRLLSMNEVGGMFDPMPPESFHKFNQARLAARPLTMNATSSHDTKRSEDVRARITILSALPDTWAARLGRWRNLNAHAKTALRGAYVPDHNEETYLYQTMLGAWPLDAEEVPSFRVRLQACLQKSLREAKVHTSWSTPDETYEKAVAHFLDAILDPSENNRFLRDFLPFQNRVAVFGALQSLSQVLLRLTCPGVPDTYQGSELWDFSLVDPDNRRPVDFQRRQVLLEDLPKRTAQELLRDWRDGAVKLHVIQRALQYRRSRLDLFLEGGYIPLYATGPRQDRTLAFARHHASDWCVTVVPRFLAKLGGRVWRGTSLALPAGSPQRWTNLLTDETLVADGGTLPLGAVLSTFPVALLSSTESS